MKHNGLLALPVLSTWVLAGVSTALAAQQAPHQGIMEVIQVTGEKTRRSLRETASSVKVMTDDDLEAMASIYNANHLLDAIPNLVTVEPGNEAPAVRGIDGTGPAKGANAFLAGTRPRLNYQIDGRTLGFNEALFQSASLWDVSQVEVYRGPQSTLQGRNSIAGAIVVNTADPTQYWEGKLRGITGGQATRIGSAVISGPLLEDVLAFRLAADYQRSKSAVEFTPYPEEHEPELYRSASYRGKLLFTPNERVRALLTLGDTDGQAPQSEYVIRPFERELAMNAKQPTFRSRNRYGQLDTRWRLSETLDVELYLSHTNFDTERHVTARLGNMDIDGDDTVIQPLMRMRTADDRLSGFVATYHFRSEQQEYIDLFGGGRFRDETKNDALFGELSWAMNERLELTLGARYDTEDRTRIGAAGPLAVDFSATYEEFLPKANVSWQASDDWTLGMTVGRGYNGGGAGITFSPPFVDYSYDPEFVWNYEAFARGALLDGRLGLSANLFYNDFKDMQLPFSLGVNSTVIRNAEQATTRGVELAAHYELSPGNELRLDLGLLSTRVDRYGDSGVQGNDLSRSPAVTLDLGVRLRPVEDLLVSADVRYSDSYYSDAVNSPRGKVDPYTVVNAQLSYHVGWARAFVSVENLLDSRHELSILTGPTAARDAATMSRPRTVTAGIELSF